MTPSSPHGLYPLEYTHLQKNRLMTLALRPERAPKQSPYTTMQLSYVGIIYLMLIYASGPPYISSISSVSWISSPTLARFRCQTHTRKMSSPPGRDDSHGRAVATNGRGREGAGARDLRAACLIVDVT